MNDLFGQPVKPATKPVAGTFHTERRTQKTMLSGLNCAAGQLDLFDVDGVKDSPAFRIGQRVRSVHAFSSPARDGVIAEVRQSRSGHTFYVLADGGWFSAHELEAR